MALSANLMDFIEPTCSEHADGTSTDVAWETQLGAGWFDEYGDENIFMMTPLSHIVRRAGLSWNEGKIVRFGTQNSHQLLGAVPNQWILDFPMNQVHSGAIVSRWTIPLSVGRQMSQTATGFGYCRLDRAALILVLVNEYLLDSGIDMPVHEHVKVRPAVFEVRNFTQQFYRDTLAGKENRIYRSQLQSSTGQKPNVLRSLSRPRRCCSIRLAGQIKGTMPSLANSPIDYVGGTARADNVDGLSELLF